MKNGKDRGEPGKNLSRENVTGREDLITCGRTSELAHALLTRYTRQFVSLSVCQFVSLSVCQFVSLSVCQSGEKFLTLIGLNNFQN